MSNNIVHVKRKHSHQMHVSTRRSMHGLQIHSVAPICGPKLTDAAIEHLKTQLFADKLEVRAAVKAAMIEEWNTIVAKVKLIDPRRIWLNVESTAGLVQQLDSWGGLMMDDIVFHVPEQGTETLLVSPLKSLTNIDTTETAAVYSIDVTGWKNIPVSHA